MLNGGNEFTVQSSIFEGCWPASSSAARFPSEARYRIVTAKAVSIAIPAICRLERKNSSVRSGRSPRSASDERTFKWARTYAEVIKFPLVGWSSPGTVGRTKLPGLHYVSSHGYRIAERVSTGRTIVACAESIYTMNQIAQRAEASAG